MKKVFKPVKASVDEEYGASLASDVESIVNSALTKFAESNNLSSAEVEWSDYDDSELEDNSYLKVTMSIGIDV